MHVKVKVLVPQSCPTLWNPMDHSSPGSSVYGILQARILEWVAISFSRGFFWPSDRTCVCYTAGRFFPIWVTREALYLSICIFVSMLNVGLFEPLWTVACQVSLFMDFSRQEYWGRLPCPPPGNLPKPEIESISYDIYLHLNTFPLKVIINYWV